MKTANIILRISPEQKKTWVEYAKLMGISVGELIRTAVEKEINSGPTEEIFKKQE